MKRGKAFFMQIFSPWVPHIFMLWGSMVYPCLLILKPQLRLQITWEQLGMMAAQDKPLPPSARVRDRRTILYD